MSENPDEDDNKHGTAMGTRMAPAFANLFMGNFEEKALGGFQDKLLFWFRYINDIFKVWAHGNEKLFSVWCPLAETMGLPGFPGL